MQSIRSARRRGPTYVACRCAHQAKVSSAADRGPRVGRRRLRVGLETRRRRGGHREVRDGMALPAGGDAGPVRREPCHDDRRRRRLAPVAGRPPGGRLPVRLLLRLPDRELPEDGELEPEDRAGRSGDSRRAGIALLAGVPSLGPDVPPADRCGAARHRQVRARDQHRVQEPARRLAGLPEPRQRRAAVHPDRPLAGSGDADPAHPERDRCESRVAEAARLGHRPRRERPGADRQECRRQLPARPGLPGGRPDRLRHRLLVVPEPAAGAHPVRTAGHRCQRAVRPDRDERPAGALREPGRPRRRQRCTRALLHRVRAAAARASPSARRGSPTRASTPPPASRPAATRGCR